MSDISTIDCICDTNAIKIMICITIAYRLMLISARSKKPDCITFDLYLLCIPSIIILNLYGRSLYNDEYSLIKKKKKKKKKDLCVCGVFSCGFVE